MELSQNGGHRRLSSPLRKKRAARHQTPRRWSAVRCVARKSLFEVRSPFGCYEMAQRRWRTKMIGATQKRIELGLVTNASAGWKTVRRRWEMDLAMYSPAVHHIEDHWRSLASVTERFGPRSIGHALAGRAAARAAIDAGAKVILLSTLQNAPFAPLEKGVRYIVYGDCTSAQLATNYGGKTLGAPGSWICARIRRLKEHGCIFLCMSKWYQDALREEFEIPENQLQILPFYVDTDIWKPQANKARSRAQAGPVHRRRPRAQGRGHRLRTRATR